MTLSPALATTSLQPAAPAAQWPVLTELNPDQAQKVFHAIMEAFSRPGTVHSIADQAPAAPVPAVVTPLLTLADLMSPITVLETAGVDLGEAQQVAAIISRLTGAPIAAPSDTRFALALSEPQHFADLNQGSHWSPEFGATLVQRVSAVGTDLPEGLELTLSGPGIRPDLPTVITIEGLSPAWFETRAALTSSYPSGIDCILMTDEGTFIAIPRTTKIEVR